MTNRNKPYHNTIPYIAADLIPFLSTLRRFVRTRDIADDFAAKYPKHRMQYMSKNGRKNVLGHVMVTVLPVWTKNSKYGIVFDNIYSKDYPAANLADAQESEATP